ncbi:L-rhamnose mutarotase [Catenovulum adriaticum]|uniref:L-rhamnose mutarotase n=1 Tax=Catenovulum adriaticum TaxID=2984846 RepID=A0ABY7AUD4_9ALTE|nr:L-rhamnose mutarotase [Catenovulum sp. TS8]WAJ72387.1 L-rhamnose mutarotase [Catenovulum sp. TS8]
MANNKRICLALDLVDDATLISEYIDYHQPQNAWPQITQNIRDKGIIDMEIYHVADRLFMIMEVGPDFDPNKAPATQAGIEKDEAWEQLMWKYQKALACAKPGEKWVEMQKIYDLKNAL